MREMLIAIACLCGMAGLVFITIAGSKPNFEKPANCLDIIRVDKCQYIVYTCSDVAMVHHGNCDNPKHNK